MMKIFAIIAFYLLTGAAGYQLKVNKNTKNPGGRMSASGQIQPASVTTD